MHKRNNSLLGFVDGLLVFVCLLTSHFDVFGVGRAAGKLALSPLLLLLLSHVRAQVDGEAFEFGLYFERLG